MRRNYGKYIKMCKMDNYFYESKSKRTTTNKRTRREKELKARSTEHKSTKAQEENNPIQKIELIKSLPMVAPAPKIAASPSLDPNLLNVPECWPCCCGCCCIGGWPTGICPGMLSELCDC